MNGGKKYIVISQEEYDRVKKLQNDPLVNPIKKDINRSVEEMTKVWDRNFPVDEQIRLFTKELNNLKTGYETLKKPKKLQVVMVTKEDKKD